MKFKLRQTEETFQNIHTLSSAPKGTHVIVVLVLRCRLLDEEKEDEETREREEKKYSNRHIIKTETDNTEDVREQKRCERDMKRIKKKITGGKEKRQAPENETTVLRVQCYQCKICECMCV